MVATIPHNNIKPVEDEKPIDLAKILVSPGLEAQMAKDLTLDFSLPKATTSSGTSGVSAGGLSHGGYRGYKAGGTKAKAPTKKELEAMAAEEQARKEAQFQAFIVDKIKAYTPIGYGNHTSQGIEELRDRFFRNEYMPTVEEMSKDENGVVDNAKLLHYLQLWQGYNDKKRGLVNGISNAFDQDIIDKKAEEDESLTIFNAISNFFSTQVATKGSAAIRGMFASTVNTLAKAGNALGIVDDDTVELTAKTVAETKKGEDAKIDEAVQGNYRSKFNYMRSVERALDGRDSAIDALMDQPFTTITDAIGESALPMIGGIALGGGAGLGARALGMAATRAAGLGTAFGGGAIGGASVVNQAQYDILDKSDEEIKETEEYKTKLQELRSQHPDWDDKRADDEATAFIPQIKNSLMTKSSVPAALSGFVTGAALSVLSPVEALAGKLTSGYTGKALGKAFGSSGAVGRAAKGVGLEAASEGVEEGLEQLQSNMAVNYATGKPLTENALDGVVDSAIMGAVSGGPMGATGAFHKGNVPDAQSAQGIGGDGEEVSVDGSSTGNSGAVQNGGAGGASGASINTSNNNDPFLSAAGQRHAAANAQNTGITNGLIQSAHGSSASGTQGTQGTGNTGITGASGASGVSQPVQGTPSPAQTSPQVSGATVQNVPDVTTLTMDASVKPLVSGSFLPSSNPTAAVDVNSNEYKSAVSNLAQALSKFGLSKKATATVIKGITDNAKTAQDFNNSVNSLLYSYIRGASNANTGQSSGTGNTANSPATPAGQTGSGQTQTAGTQGAQGNSGATPGAGSVGAARPNPGAASGNIQPAQPNGNGSGQGTNGGSGGQSNAGTGSQPNTGNGSNAGSGVQQSGNANGAAATGSNPQPSVNGVREKDLDLEQRFVADVAASCGDAVNNINAFVESELNNVKQNSALDGSLRIKAECEKKAADAKTKLEKTLGTSLPNEFQEAIAAALYNYVEIHNSVCEPKRRLTAFNVQRFFDFCAISRGSAGSYRPARNIASVVITIDIGGVSMKSLIADGIQHKIPSNQIADEMATLVLKTLMHEMQHSLAFEVANAGSEAKDPNGQITTNQQKARELLQNLTARAVQLTQDSNSTLAKNKNLVSQTHTDVSSIATSHDEMLTTALEMALNDPDKFVQSKIFDKPSQKKDFIRFVTETYKAAYQLCARLLGSLIGNATKFKKERRDASTYADYRALYAQAMLSSKPSVDNQVYKNLVRNFGYMWSLSTYNPLVAMQRQLGDVSGVNKVDGSEAVLSSMFNEELETVTQATQQYLAANNINQPIQPNVVYNTALRNCIKRMMPNIDNKSLDMLVNAFGVDENMNNKLAGDLLFERSEDGYTTPFTSLSDISGQLNRNVFGIKPGELEANFAAKYDKNIDKVITDPLNVGLPVSDVVDTAIDKTVTDTIKETVQEIDSTTGDRLDLDNVDKRQEMYLDAYNNAAEALNAYADKKTDNNLLDAIDAVAVVESMNDTDTDYSDNDMLFNSQRSLDEIIEATEFTAAMNSPYENRLDMDERTTINNDVIPQKTDEQKVEEILNNSDEIISGISDGYENPEIGDNVASTDDFKNTYDGPVDENGNPKIQYIEMVDGKFRVVQEDTGADTIIPVYINADGSFQSINQKNVMPYDKLSAGIGAWTGLDAAHQAGESLNLNKQLHILKSNAAATGVKLTQYMRKLTQIRSTFADRQAHFRTWSMTHLAQTDGTVSDMNALYQPYVHLPSAMRGAKAEVSELITNPRVQRMEALCAPIMQAKGITSRTDTRAFVSQMVTRFGMYQTLMHTIESSYKQENDIQQKIIDIHTSLTDAANDAFADWYADHINKTGVPPSPTDMQNKIDALYLQRDQDFLDNTQKLRKDLNDLRLQQANGSVTHNKNIIAPFGGRTRIECVNEISNLISELGTILPKGVDPRAFLEQGHAVINQEMESMIKMAAEKGLIDDEWIATFGDFDYYCPLTVQQNKDANALDHKGIAGARVDYARQGSHTPAQDAISAITAMEGRFARNIATADFGQSAVYFYEQLRRGVKQAEVVHDGAYGIAGLKSYDGFVVIPAGKLNQLRDNAVASGGDVNDLSNQFGNIANNLMYVNTNVMTISDDIYQTDAAGNPVGKKPLFKKGTIISTQDQIRDLENFFGMKYEDMLGRYVHSENGGYYVGFDLNAGESLKDAHGNAASPEEKAKYGADLKNVHDAFHSIMEAGDVSKSKLIGAAAFVTNSMSQLYTTFNVFFAPKNAIKDTKERLTYITSRNYRGADGNTVSGFKVGITMRKKLLSPAWYWRMTKAVWTKGKIANPSGDPKIDRANELAKVFIYKGVGSTSNIQTMFEHQANLLANDLHSDELLGAFSAEDRGFIKRNWARFTAVFRRWAEAWYAIPAMAQMEAMTENGITDDDAVFHTKSLMNLDQKGTFMGRSFMRALFPFGSSIGQGALQHTYALTSGIDMGMSTNRGAAVKQICKSIGVMAYCVAKYTFMIQFAMLCMGGDDEEDKARRLETLLKEDAAPLILGDDLVFNMPVSFGPEKMAWSFAKDMFKMSRGHMDLGSAAANMLSSYIHNIAPMGNPQFDFKSDPFTHMALTLTGGSPILYGVAVMGTGKNAFGSSLEPKYTSPGDRRSDYYTIGMNKGYIEMAQFLYNISGGHVDVTPAEIKTLANTYLAGPFRAIVQVFEAKNNPLRGTQLDKTKGGPVMSAFGLTSWYDKITTESYLEISRAENYYNNLLKDAGVADALKGKGIDGTNASKREAELFRLGFSPREVEDYLLLANYQKESRKLTGEYKRRLEMSRAVNNEGYEIKVLTELARQQQLLMQNTIKNLYYYDRNFKQRSAVPNQYYAEQARQRAMVSGD